MLDPMPEKAVLHIQQSTTYLTFDIPITQDGYLQYQSARDTINSKVSNSSTTEVFMFEIPSEGHPEINLEVNRYIPVLKNSNEIDYTKVNYDIELDKKTYHFKLDTFNIIN